MTCPRAGPNQVSHQLTSGAVLSYAFSARGFFHSLLEGVQEMLNLPAYFYFSITVISIESVLGNAWVLRSVPNQCILLYPSKLTTAHTSAKFIEIQQKSLQRRHGLHEL